MFEFIKAASDTIFDVINIYDTYDKSQLLGQAFEFKIFANKISHPSLRKTYCTACLGSLLGVA